MRHLALIIANDLNTLERLQHATDTAGFNANCSNDAAIAQTLVARYADDYHVIISDIAVFNEHVDRFVRGIRSNAPKSRVLIVNTTGQEYESRDPFVAVLDIDAAIARLPRLKREVTRYRSSPVNKSHAALGA